MLGNFEQLRVIEAMKVSLMGKSTIHHIPHRDFSILLLCPPIDHSHCTSPHKPERHCLSTKYSQDLLEGQNQVGENEHGQICYIELLKNQQQSPPLYYQGVTVQQSN